MSEIAMSLPSPLPPQKDVPASLEDALLAYAGRTDITHKDIADELNALTVDVARTKISAAEIIDHIDTDELKGLGAAVSLGLLDFINRQGSFDPSGKPWQILLGMVPISEKALTDFASSLKTIPWYEHIGLGYPAIRPLDFGDVAAVFGHEPDVFDGTTGLRQSASGLSIPQRQTIVAANQAADFSALTASYTKQQLESFLSMPDAAFEASGIDVAVKQVAVAANTAMLAREAQASSAEVIRG